VLVVQEKKKPPVSSDVAAFASRAKVVYPINQKYRVSIMNIYSLRQRQKHSRAEGKTAPKKYNVAPDIRRRGRKCPWTSSDNYDNLIAFCLCSLLCVQSVLPVLNTILFCIIYKTERLKR